MKFEWETIQATPNNVIFTHRAKVIGGWIVKNSIILEGDQMMGMVFIPDPEHKWDINS